jgi:hypothetical protein
LSAALAGRDHLWRFLPGAEWKKLPESCKAPNKGRRLRPRPRHVVRFFCELCGLEAKRHRRSARYCSTECRRRAQLERDARRRGKPLPNERARGAKRREIAQLKGIRQHGSLYDYLRFTEEQKRKREAAQAERWRPKMLSPQEEWINYHRSGLALQERSGVIRYVRVFRP